MTSHTRLVRAAIVACWALISFISTGATAFDGCSVKPSSSLVVNVRDRGAKGDGKTNDTAAIQRAITEVTGTGGTVFIPNGVYMVEAVGKSLRLGSKMTLRMADNAMLKVIPNREKRYSTLTIRKVSDVTVIGGTLFGDRREHKSKQGEHGMGLWIGPEARRIAVVGLTSRNMWGDGFYVSGAADIAFCSVSAINNRRQGLSIIDAKRVLVTDSVFRDTRGTRPSAGIDMEPDKPTQRISNIRIERSKFINNEGDGIVVAGHKAIVENVEIRNNLFDGNDQPILVENARGVRSRDICDNRVVSHTKKPATGLNPYAETVQVVSPQMDCRLGSDMRFEKSRTTKQNKKNKRPKPQVAN
jgi:pectate lyase-like protein/parallel beta helix pectate lyase-like protein